MDMEAPMAGLVIEQFTDIFRIGMILFLVVTSVNTARATPTRAGRAAPLVLGVLFIAVLIPVSFQRDAPDLLPRILLGVAVNAIWLGIMLALLFVWKRMRP